MLHSTRPRVPFADRERWWTCKELQPPLSYFVLHPLLHHRQSHVPMPLRNLQTKHQSEFPPRVHPTKRVQRDVIGTVEVRALEDQDDFGEHGGFDRGDDIVKEIWSVSASVRHGGCCDLERSKRAEMRKIKILEQFLAGFCTMRQCECLKGLGRIPYCLGWSGKPSPSVEYQRKPPRGVATPGR